VASPFQIRAHLIFTGVPEGGLTPHGILPGYLAHYLVDSRQAEADWIATEPGERGTLNPADYINTVGTTSIETAANAALAAGADVFIEDSEVSKGFIEEVMFFLPGDGTDQGLIDLILDAHALAYAEFKARAPNIRYGHYDLFAAGNYLWHADPVTYASQLTALYANWSRLHQRWDGDSLVDDPRALYDIVACNAPPSPPTRPEMIAYIRAVLTAARDRLAPNDEPVWWYTNTHSYGSGDRGMPMPAEQTQRLLLAVKQEVDGVRYADGAFFWYEGMASQAWPYFRVSVLTSTAATWAAVTDAKFRIFIAASTEVAVTVDFTGVTDMDEVAAALESAVNTARDDDYGTLSVAWTGTELRFTLSHEGGTYTSPPGNRGQMTSLGFSFNADGAQSIGSDGYGLIDAGLGSATPVPFPAPTDEFDNWVLDGDGNLRDIYAAIGEARDGGTIPMLTLLTHLKAGQASNSSNIAHYTEGATIPETDIKAVRFQPDATTAKWWMLNSPDNGAFTDWDEADIAFTGILHLASGPPASGGDTVLDFKDASGTNSKLSLYAQDDGTLILLDRAYNGFVIGSETPNLVGGTYYIQIVAGTGTTAMVRLKVFTLAGVEVFDSGDMTVHTGTNNYARVYLGRTTTFNTSPMDIYWGPAGAAAGTTAVPVGFRGGSLRPTQEVDAGTWAVGSVEDLSDDDLDTVADTSDADTECEFSIQSLAAAGISTESILGVRLFSRMGRTDAAATAQLKLTSAASSVSTSTFTLTNDDEAYSLMQDTDPATSAAWTPSGLESATISAVSVDPGSGTTDLSEFSVEFLYIPRAAGGGGGQRRALGMLTGLGILDDDTE
jgi:hypothetical protein